MFSAVSLARHTRAQLTSNVCVLTPASVAVCVTPCYLRLSTEQRHTSEEIVVHVSSLSLSFSPEDHLTSDLRARESWSVLLPRAYTKEQNVMPNVLYING